jgi:hypothetical protein
MSCYRPRHIAALKSELHRFSLQFDLLFEASVTVVPSELFRVGIQLSLLRKIAVVSATLDSL